MAGQVIVKTEHKSKPMPPVTCAFVAFARLSMWRFRVLIFPCFHEGMVKEEEMKLHVFFVLIDLMILLAYPFIFIASKVRKYFGFKR